MVFVFWQGIISIHQKAFLEALALQPDVSAVVLVVEEEITPYRKNMGWEIPVIEHVDIRRSPTNKEIESIVKANKDAVHIMGGIRNGNMLRIAFDECVKEHCRIGIMTEPYNKAGLKGRLRAIKYQYYGLRYFRHIQFVLAIGRQGVAQFKALGFDAQFTFPWAYFMSLDINGSRHAEDKPVRRIIYAGRLENGKGIYKFTEKLIQSESSNYQLDFYGAGADESRLKQLIDTSGKMRHFNFYPFLKYEELLSRYRDYDWVALPSTQKDGWGVIVSEGLLSGLKAICSSMCGVSWVIKEGYNGVVFDWKTDGDCSKAISKMLGDETFAVPETISAWANTAISGNAGAAYFMKIIACVYHQKEKPEMPWA